MLLLLLVCIFTMSLTACSLDTGPGSQQQTDQDVDVLEFPDQDLDSEDGDLDTPTEAEESDEFDGNLPADEDLMSEGDAEPDGDPDGEPNSDGDLLLDGDDSEGTEWDLVQDGDIEIDWELDTELDIEQEKDYEFEEVTEQQALECLDRPCGLNAVCFDLSAGGYSCECPYGFRGDPLVRCDPVQTCDQDNGGCDPLTSCEEHAGGTTCGPCPEGFEGDGRSGCADLNECLQDNGGCDSLTACINTIGSFECGDCPDGYTGDGVVGCEDINECGTNRGGCDALTECVNLPGSYECGPCPSGYHGDGLTGCEPDGPCEVDNGGCDPLAVCDDTSGVAVCGDCPEEYSGNGVNGCIPILSEHFGRFTIPDTGNKKVQYYRNYGLGYENLQIEYAVIVVHGLNRNAGEYYEWLYHAAQYARATNNTLLIAPRFILPEDSPDEFDLYWETSAAWKRGDLCAGALGVEVSSYTVMDTLMDKLTKYGKFPNLKGIVLIGHSAGAQYVQRYAAGNEDESTLGVPVRYVVSNCATFLYLDDKRFDGEQDFLFEVPQTGCMSYNDYKFGLNDLNYYMGRVGATRIRLQMEQRDIVYLLGSEDTEIDENLEITCEAMLQGENRLRRGQIYFNHIAEYYGYQPHLLVIAQGIGHNGYGILNSPEGVQTIFGDRDSQ